MQPTERCSNPVDKLAFSCIFRTRHSSIRTYGVYSILFLKRTYVSYAYLAYVILPIFYVIRKFPQMDIFSQLFYITCKFPSPSINAPLSLGRGGKQPLHICPLLQNFGNLTIYIFIILRKHSLFSPVPHPSLSLSHNFPPLSPLGQNISLLYKLQYTYLALRDLRDPTFVREVPKHIKRRL